MRALEQSVLSRTTRHFKSLGSYYFPELKAILKASTCTHQKPHVADEGRGKPFCASQHCAMSKFFTAELLP